MSLGGRSQRSKRLSTLEEPLSWANTRLVSEDAVEAVAEMKLDGNNPMRTVGSLALCRSLLDAGLVDRFRNVHGILRFGVEHTSMLRTHEIAQCPLGDLDF